MVSRTNQSSACARSMRLQASTCAGVAPGLRGSTCRLELVGAQDRGSRRRARAPSRAATSRRPRPRSPSTSLRPAPCGRAHVDRRARAARVERHVDVLVVVTARRRQRASGVRGNALRRRGGRTAAASSSARVFTDSANGCGLAHVVHQPPLRRASARTPSAVVQKTSARSRRTLRLSTMRVRPPVPGSTPSSGTSGRLTAVERSSTSDDLVAGERQLVAAAGGGAVERGDELAGPNARSNPPCRCASRW